MARVHKVSMYIVDTDDRDNIEELIERGIGRYDLYPSFIHKKSSESFEWDDDLTINSVDATKDDFNNYLV